MAAGDIPFLSSATPIAHSEIDESALVGGISDFVVGRKRPSPPKNEPEQERRNRLQDGLPPIFRIVEAIVFIPALFDWMTTTKEYLPAASSPIPSSSRRMLAPPA